VPLGFSPLTGSHRLWPFLILPRTKCGPNQTARVRESLRRSGPSCVHDSCLLSIYVSMISLAPPPQLPLIQASRPHAAGTGVRDLRVQTGACNTTTIIPPSRICVGDVREPARSSPVSRHTQPGKHNHFARVIVKSLTVPVDGCSVSTISSRPATGCRLSPPSPRSARKRSRP
jgi:hypothetical protein